MLGIKRFIADKFRQKRIEVERSKSLENSALCLSLIKKLFVVEEGEVYNSFVISNNGGEYPVYLFVTEGSGIDYEQIKLQQGKLKFSLLDFKSYEVPFLDWQIYWSSQKSRDYRPFEEKLLDVLIQYQAYKNQKEG